ncbi:hypothetical protein MFFC18_18340 [Mariniblastus fucicola]|uniref:Uncharacterized protein n=1 Tax=Mariniblastus fucicola TaxID=980251 RepID=A0A5B9PGT8_9BACT|nr:hypothetical protein MFFC18_18340 [Mariniblastus fucicola]
MPQACRQKCVVQRSRPDNNALNRSGDGVVVGLSPDGRRLPLYPTPLSLIHISWSARLTRTLSSGTILRRQARDMQENAVGSVMICNPYAESFDNWAMQA